MNYCPLCREIVRRSRCDYCGLPYVETMDNPPQMYKMEMERQRNDIVRTVNDIGVVLWQYPRDHQVYFPVLKSNMLNNDIIRLPLPLYYPANINMLALRCHIDERTLQYEVQLPDEVIRDQAWNYFYVELQLTWSLHLKVYICNADLPKQLLITELKLQFRDILADDHVR